MKRTQLILLAAVLLLAGCGQKRTAISSILGHADEFIDREVIVGGEVTKAYAADLFIAEAGAYQVDDGTGRIWVITKAGVPQEGKSVVLKATVVSGLKIGGESFGAVLREIERRSG